MRRSPADESASANAKAEAPFKNARPEVRRMGSKLTSRLATSGRHCQAYPAPKNRLTGIKPSRTAPPNCDLRTSFAIVAYFARLLDTNRANSNLE